MKLIVKEYSQNGKVSEEAYEEVIQKIDTLQQDLETLKRFIDTSLHNLEATKSVIVGNKEIEREDGLILTTYTQTLNNLKECERELKFSKTADAIRQCMYMTIDTVDMVDNDVKPHR